LLHLEPDRGASVASTLERYVLSTQVDIDDITQEMGLVLVVGPSWREAASGAELAALQPTASLGVDAGYLWIRSAATASLLESIARSGGRVAGDNELEAIRISNGIARWGRDMDEKTFPQEAGVDERAVHYDKGCYLGQEAMAKIHFRGKVNRRLARLRAASPVTPGSEVTLDGTGIGKITSASEASALAMIRYSVTEGAKVTIGDVTAEVVG
jgi:folate-binding protein YgfZ